MICQSAVLFDFCPDVLQSKPGVLLGPDAPWLSDTFPTLIYNSPFRALSVCAALFHTCFSRSIIKAQTDTSVIELHGSERFLTHAWFKLEQTRNWFMHAYRKIERGRVIIVTLRRVCIKLHIASSMLSSSLHWVNMPYSLLFIKLYNGHWIIVWSFWRTRVRSRLNLVNPFIRFSEKNTTPNNWRPKATQLLKGII